MKIEFQGTKGEWKATKEHSNVRKVDMFTIHTGESPQDYQLDNGEWVDPTIAGIWLVDPLLHDECQANAQLISAAPDLLKALQDITELFKRVDPLYLGDKRRIEQAEAAINKALGE